MQVFSVSLQGSLTSLSFISPFLTGKKKQFCCLMLQRFLCQMIRWGAWRLLHSWPYKPNLFWTVAYSQAGVDAQTSPQLPDLSRMNDPPRAGTPAPLPPGHKKSLSKHKNKAWMSSDFFSKVWPKINIIWYYSKYKYLPLENDSADLKLFFYSWMIWKKLLITCSLKHPDCFCWSPIIFLILPS